MSALDTHRAGVTVLILIPNAGDRMERCLRSVSWADRLFCVVDPNTRDGSDEIARRYSDHVVIHEYVNKAAQCNWALPRIETEWTFVLDADEWVSLVLARKIQEIVGREGGPDGYRVKRLDYFFGKLIHHCGKNTDYNLRLFRTAKGRYRDQWVHSTVDVKGVVGRLDAVMYHDDKRDFEEYFATFHRFTGWAARDMFEKGKNATLADLVLRPMIRFIKMYLLRLGFLDGRHGAVLCGLAAFSVFTKYAKLWNMRRLEAGGAEGIPADAIVKTSEDAQAASSKVPER